MQVKRYQLGEFELQIFTQPSSEQQTWQLTNNLSRWKDQDAAIYTSCSVSAEPQLPMKTNMRATLSHHYGGWGVCGVLFPDLKKTFGTVNHQIMATKRSNYGLQPFTIRWVTSQLDGCHQVVRVGHSISFILLETCNASRSSTLGALLFSIILMFYHFIFVS